eukprot:tig00000254_g22590.t1
MVLGGRREAAPRRAYEAKVSPAAAAAAADVDADDHAHDQELSPGSTSDLGGGGGRNWTAGRSVSTLDIPADEGGARELVGSDGAGGARLQHVSAVAQRVYGFPRRAGALASGARAAVHAKRSSTAAVSTTQQAKDAGASIWKGVATGNLAMVREHVEDAASRGPTGATPAHVLLLLHKGAHREILELLLEAAPELLNATVTGNMYEGETLMHVCAVNRDVETLSWLLSRPGCDVASPRATGSFFSPSGSLYLGETVLAFAVCRNDRRMVAVLLERGGADVNAADGHGNTALHMAVIHGRRTMYDFLVDRYKADPGRRNKMGLTPYLLSVQLGSVRMFSHITQRNKEVNWRFGPVTSYLFDLTELDNARTPERSKAPSEVSGLELAVQGGHIGILSEVVFQRILEGKWRTFARRFLLVWFLFDVFAIVAFGVSASLRSDPSCCLDGTALCDSCGPELRASNAAVLAASGTSLLVACAATVSHHLPSGRGRLPSGGLPLLWALLGVPAALSLACLPMRLASSSHEVDLYAAAAMAWVARLFFFLSLTRRAGHYVVMVRRMVAGDIFKFAMLFCSVLLAFSLAFRLEMMGAHPAATAAGAGAAEDGCSFGDVPDAALCLNPPGVYN